MSQPGRRNPPSRTRRVSRPASLLSEDGPRTAGRMLFEMAASRPVSTDPREIERTARLIGEAARLLKAEAEAGMWSSPR